MILPPHHTLNFLSLSIEKSIKCRTGPGNDFVAICKFGNFPQRLQKQNANDLWDNILQKDKWEADEGLPWSAPQFPSRKKQSFYHICANILSSTLAWFKKKKIGFEV